MELSSDKPFYSVSDFYKTLFGCKVYKLSVDIGCTCPNRDGTKGTRGCIFCSNGGSGEFSVTPTGTLGRDSAAHVPAISNQDQNAVLSPSAITQSRSPRNPALSRSSPDAAESPHTSAPDITAPDITAQNAASLDISMQLEKAKSLVRAKTSDQKFIAYFQNYTNTYGSFDRLSAIFTQAANTPGIVGLAIATRPDCLSPQMLSFLAQLSQRTFIQLEFGLQTASDQSALYIRRAYPTSEYIATMKRVKKLAPRIHVVTHIIFGLPGETQVQMMQTVRLALSCKTDGIKITCLHVLKGTDLETDFCAQKFRTLEQQEYFELIAQALKIIGPNVVIHRITGDGDKRTLVAPLWSANKKAVYNSLMHYLRTAHC